MTARAAATTTRSRRNTAWRALSVMAVSLEITPRAADRRRTLSAAGQSMIGPADRSVMSVLARIVPAHAVIAERVPVRSNSERQFVGADRMTKIRPNLSARMGGRQRIHRHVQDVRNFCRSLLAVDPIRDRHLLHAEVLGYQRRESRHRPAGGAGEDRA